jgi:two-component system response regulator AtoC
MQPSKFFFGAVVSSGLTAQAIDRAGADFLLVLNAGRMRLRGASSLTCYLPLRPSNEWVFEIAEQEILGRCKAPVLAGICVSDPTTRLEDLVDKVIRLGFSGVSNFPPAILLDGRLRQLLEDEGLGFARECELIRLASKKGLKTVAYVATNKEARAMVDAGAETICVNIGFTGGATGVNTNLTIESAADLASRVLEGIPATIHKLVEGGPIASPEDAMAVARLSPAQGYIAGSTLDRFPIEQALDEVARSYKVISTVNQPKETSETKQDSVVGSSIAMQDIRKMIAEVANSDIPVLIQGETGSGKSLIAMDILQKSGRASRTQIVVDCASLTDDEGEAQLLGVAAGAVKRNTVQARGALEAADKGTLIIEDLASMRERHQGLILKFSDTGLVQRIGDIEGRNVDVRIISTALPEIQNRLEAGSFRPDLLYRLNGFEINVPPLNARRDDIPELATYFANKLSNGKPPQFSNAALSVLIEHDWPGNVRELQFVVRRILATLKNDTVTVRDVSFLSRQSSTLPKNAVESSDNDHNPKSERDWILTALTNNNFRRGNTAKDLGMSTRTLYNKIQHYGLV